MQAVLRGKLTVRPQEATPQRHRAPGEAGPAPRARCAVATFLRQTDCARSPDHGLSWLRLLLLQPLRSCRLAAAAQVSGLLCGSKFEKMQNLQGKGCLGADRLICPLHSSSKSSPIYGHRAYSFQY